MAGTEKKDYGSAPALEKHYRVKQVATMWGMSRNTITKLFRDEPDVIKLRGGRATTLWIPLSVLERVRQRLSGNTLQAALTPGNPTIVESAGNLRRGVAKQPRDIVKLNARCKPLKRTKATPVEPVIPNAKPGGEQQ